MIKLRISLDKMAELTVENLIKIILGILVFVAVVAGVYLVFKNNFFDFFSGLNQTEPGELILSLVR